MAKRSQKPSRATQVLPGAKVGPASTANTPAATKPVTKGPTVVIPVPTIPQKVVPHAPAPAAAPSPTVAAAPTGSFFSFGGNKHVAPPTVTKAPEPSAQTLPLAPPVPVNSVAPSAATTPTTNTKPVTQPPATLVQDGSTAAKAPPKA